VKKLEKKRTVVVLLPAWSYQRRVRGPLSMPSWHVTLPPERRCVRDGTLRFPRSLIITYE